MPKTTTTVKKVIPTNDVCIQFTEDELIEYGWDKNQKFTMEVTPEGHVVMKPYVKMELDMSEFPRELLEKFIAESCERDVSVNEVLSDIMKAGLDKLDKEDPIDYSSLEFTEVNQEIPAIDPALDYNKKPKAKNKKKK